MFAIYHKKASPAIVWPFGAGLRCNNGPLTLRKTEAIGMAFPRDEVMGAANAALEGRKSHDPRGTVWGRATDESTRLIAKACPKISAAKTELLKFLSNDTIPNQPRLQAMRKTTRNYR
jgi:hypothetical protein